MISDHNKDKETQFVFKLLVLKFERNVPTETKTQRTTQESRRAAFLSNRQRCKSYANTIEQRFEVSQLYLLLLCIA